MVSGSLLRVLARNFDVFAGPLITLVYPLYASVRTIETRSPVDDQQWLTYWVLYSLTAIFELTFAKPLQWFALWPYAKLIFTSWLVLPYFNGSAYVYQQFVRPFFVNQASENTGRMAPTNNMFSYNPKDILAAAERYIHENGPEEFERLISKAESLSKYRSSKRLSFDDLEADREGKYMNMNMNFGARNRY